MQRNDPRLRPIPGFPNYYVEEVTGNIWSFKRYKDGKILKPRVTGCNQNKKPKSVAVDLYKNGKCHRRIVSRLIMNVTDPKITVDHEDRNIWNNKKKNLRKANNSQQNCNRAPYSKTGFKGVYIRLNSNYEVYLRRNKNNISLGSYCNVYEAAAIWNIEASKHHGKFAVYNKVDGYILTI